MNETRVAAPEENAQIADLLRETAQLLEAQGANPFRVNAYRNAAAEIARLPESVRAIFDEKGVAGLEALPHIGRGIAAAIAEMLITGRWSQLERLRGTVDAVQLFRTVPGIGPGLAERIHDELHVDTLEALEVAAHDGRLEAVAGVGPRRAAAIRAALENMLRRRRVRGPIAPTPARGPQSALLLEVDREYRDKAEAGKLATIAPRRLNPEGKWWLPVLHAHRDGWHFTALYSNTAQAHRLGKVRDWVVIYFYDHDHAEGQHTVVTETRGPLAGRRVVRGREPECKEHYAGLDFSTADKRR
ncbi:MAG: helix-hairpin-helix domain-containing protein [Betaproteobacteria bacterium]|nr:helix-hairpin-helix domain-containing protein [Betaproteobacteria bacterium]MDH3437807.1 helix-hairpin-helix domain-containing protein [Betaproteobacteria bacterium]